MDKRRIGWIGAIAGATLGVTVAVIAVVFARGAEPLNLEPNMLLPWGGGIAGGIIGVLGGAFGTYAGIKSTHGPRERALAIRASIFCWILVLTFLIGMFLIPSWYNQLLWVPYALVLGIGIRWCNQEQVRIRREESSQAA